MSRTQKHGWIPHEKREYGVAKQAEAIMQDLPLLTKCGKSIMGTGKGKTVRLDRILVDVAGYYPIVRQTIGDCVSFGWAKAIMLTLAADIRIRGEAEKWPGFELSTEWIYGTSRVLSGRGRLRNSDGSVGAWAADAVLNHGTLLRRKYEIDGEVFDLRRYSGRRAKEWGFRGLPAKALEPTADEHPISRKAAICRSYEEARDAIANGYAVPVCSNQGFRDTRDSQGFLRPSGSWAHCMCFFATNEADNPRRPGLGLDNTSWGAWCSGPNPDNLPDGCGWVDAKTCDRMLRQNDSFSIPGYNGFRNRSEDLTWSPW